MTRRIHPLAAALLLVFLFSCGRDYREEMKAPIELFYRGQPYEAAQSLLPYVNKSGRDQLLFLMEAGYLLHAAEKYEDSNRVLLKAATMAKVKPISISKEVAALLTNQTMTNYRGEDFEKVLVHMYLGINYLMLDNADDAAVEFKAVNNELQKIKNEKGEARYKQNIMAKYLAAIAHELRADTTGDEYDREYAEVEYRQILQNRPDLAVARRDLASIRQRAGSGNGELVVVFQAGRAPIKVSRGRLMEDPGMKASLVVALGSQSLAAGVTAASVMTAITAAQNPIPRFQTRPNMVRCLRVSVGNRQVMTQNLENIEETAIRNLEDDYSRLRAKVAASIITKAVVSLGAGIAAQEVTRKLSDGNRGLSSLVGLLVGSGTGAALFATMRPDLRCWHTLPANLQLARVPLPPGTHCARLDFIGHYGTVVESRNVNFEINKNGKRFITIRTVQ